MDRSALSRETLGEAWVRWIQLAHVGGHLCFLMGKSKCNAYMNKVGGGRYSKTKFLLREIDRAGLLSSSLIGGEIYFTLHQLH